MKKRTAKLPSLLTEKWAQFLLPQRPKIKINPSAANPLTKKEAAEKTLLIYGSPFDKSVVAASASAERGLTSLVQLARSGNGAALWEFAKLLDEAVRSLYEIAVTSPDSIKPLARKLTHFPMPRSTAPLLCGDEELLQKIELGQLVNKQLDQHSKWKPDSAAIIAAALINHVEFIRSENPLVLDGVQEIEFSKMLPPFSKDSAGARWTAAKHFLLAAYPMPEQVSELDALVTTKSKRKYPSTRRVAILEKICARFKGMALVT